jgi:hypothetical protein
MVAGERRVIRLSGQQSRSGGIFGGKINILSEEIDFRDYTNFKLLSRMLENLINNCDLF